MGRPEADRNWGFGGPEPPDKVARTKTMPGLLGKKCIDNIGVGVDLGLHGLHGFHVCVFLMFSYFVHTFGPGSQVHKYEKYETNIKTHMTSINSMNTYEKYLKSVTPTCISYIFHICFILSYIYCHMC